LTIMPSIIATLLSSFGALALWGMPGFALARCIAPRSLALPIALVLGWACHSVVALPLFSLVGFSRWTVAAGFLIPVIAALVAITKGAPAKDDAPRVPALAYVLALALAVIPALALFPKIHGDNIGFAPAMFDHSKIALVAEVARAGIPPTNPFFSEASQALPLAYYYLWHFSAAELALAFHISAWEADIALTGFTAFASLSLLAGLAVMISKRASAGLWVIPLAFAGSINIVLEFILGRDILYFFVMPPSGLAGWLLQTTWAPQHVASAACLVLTCFILAHLAKVPSLVGALALGGLIAASYQSSIWIGIVCGVAVPLIAIVQIAMVPAGMRSRPLAMLAIAAVFAFVLSVPFLSAQLTAAAAREIAHPIVFRPHSVLNVWVPERIRWLADIPSFWLILMPMEFVAVSIPGLAALIGMLRAREPALPWAILLAASLLIASCFSITFADNNDLGWRAVLPGVFILIVFAATGLARWMAAPRHFAIAGALALLALGLPKAVDFSVENLNGWRSVQGRDFARTPELWNAVRRHTDLSERIANNPLFMDKVTSWPANISWALFADRRSCYAGRELALPFAPLSGARIDAIDAQFQRVFAGAPEANDLSDLAMRYQCKVIALTPQDGAWQHDPFAASELYTHVEEQPGRWRIYRAR